LFYFFIDLFKYFDGFKQKKQAFFFLLHIATGTFADAKVRIKSIIRNISINKFIVGPKIIV